MAISRSVGLNYRLQLETTFQTTQTTEALTVPAFSQPTCPSAKGGGPSSSEISEPLVQPAPEPAPNTVLAAALSCASSCRECGVIAPLTRTGAWILRPPCGPQPQEESSGRELGPPSRPSTPHAGLMSGSPETLGSTNGKAQVRVLWPRCTADLRSEQGGHDEGLSRLRSAAGAASPSGSTSDPRSPRFPAACLLLGQTGGRMGGRATGTWDWTEGSTLDSWILNL